MKLSTSGLTLACVFSALQTVQAATLPQTESDGSDGLFSISSDTSLFSSTNNIYNFTDFSINNGAALTINSTEPVYIYSQQSITIDGSILYSGELSLVAPDIQFLNASFDASSLTFAILNTVDDGSGNTATSYSGSTLSNNGTIFEVNGNNTTITTGNIDISAISFDITPVTSTTPDSVLILNPTPVPVPPAIALLLSGLGLLGLFSRRT